MKAADTSSRMMLRGKSKERMKGRPIIKTVRTSRRQKSLNRLNDYD